MRQTKDVIPVCCGKQMEVGLETPTFIEAKCNNCGDKIYIKKSDMQKPQMLDD